MLVGFLAHRVLELERKDQLWYFELTSPRVPDELPVFNVHTCVLTCVHGPTHRDTDWHAKRRLESKDTKSVLLSLFCYLIAICSRADHLRH